MSPLLIVKTCYFKVGENYIKTLNVHWQQCVQLFDLLWFGNILTIDYEVKIFQEGKKTSTFGCSLCWRPILSAVTSSSMKAQEPPGGKMMARVFSYSDCVISLFILFVHNLYAGYILFSSSWHHLKYSFQPTELTTNKETYLTDTVIELVSQKQMTGNNRKGMERIRVNISKEVSGCTEMRCNTWAWVHAKVMENLEKLAKSPLWTHVTASIKLFLSRVHSGYFSGETLIHPIHLLCNLCLLDSIFHITRVLLPSLPFSLNVSFVFLAHRVPSSFLASAHSHSHLYAHIWNAEARICRLKSTCGFCLSEPRLHHLEFSSYTYFSVLFILLFF